MAHAPNQNPLDVFVTYTYHFELHASTSFDELKPLTNSDSNVNTTRYNSTGTLLINTRKDAHHIIDDVKFMYRSLDSDPTAGLQAFGELTMDISEPGGMYFVQKLKDHLKKYNVTSATAEMVFALKVFFVGRKADNSIETVSLPYILPLQLQTFSANFDHLGGHYKLAFGLSAMMAAANFHAPGNVIPKIVSNLNRNISITATTVQEALSELETKLNTYYNSIYETTLENTNGARPLVYRIIVDPQINGKLNVIPGKSFTPGESSTLAFAPSQDIASMIRKILFCTDDVCKMISDSAAGIKSQFHPGVKIPTITSSYNLKSDSVELIYTISVYQGNNDARSKYEFDFYFADPGKNVDVMNFEVRFPKLETYFGQQTQFGSDFNANNTATIPTDQTEHYAKNLVHVDEKKDGIEIPLTEKKQIPVTSSGVAHVGITASDQPGSPGTRHDMLPELRLAFNTMSQAMGATDPQLNFQIRGHLNLLADCAVYPDGLTEGNPLPLGLTRGIWVKVNIKDQFGQTFFYTGYYKLFAVESIFNQGKFTQNLTVMMMQELDSNLTPGATDSSSSETFRRLEISQQNSTSQDSTTPESPPRGDL